VGIGGGVGMVVYVGWQYYYCRDVEGSLGIELGMS